MPRTIVITGVTSGFGRATAAVFIKEGWNVAGTGRRKERLDALKAEWGDAFLPLELDMRDKSAVFAALERLPAPWSEPDVLVNNAGLALGLAPSQEADLDDWETMIDTNIKGLLYATRALLPGMTARNRGHIVNLGSTAGTYPYKGGNVYGGTKAFVKQFSLNLRTDLLGTAVRVTNIEPGLCESEFRWCASKEIGPEPTKSMRAPAPSCPRTSRKPCVGLPICPPTSISTALNSCPCVRPRDR